MPTDATSTLTARRQLVGAAFAGALAAALAAPAAAEEPFVIKLASFTAPTGSLNGKAVPLLIKTVEEASAGRIKIEFYPGGTLGRSPVVQLKLVEDGVADIAQVVASYTPGRFPEMALFELPNLAKNNQEGSLAAWRMYEKGLLSGFDTTMPVAILESGPYGLHGTFPIRTLDDIAGKKLRAAGPIQGDIVRALGGVPVGKIVAPEIAESISRGLLDGTLMSVGSLFGFRINDVAFHHLNQVPMGSVTVLFVMNKAKYESMPADLKPIWDKYAGEWFTREGGKALDETNEEYLAEIRGDPKHTIYELTAEQRAAWDAKLDGIKAKWDQPNDKGVNLYQEVTAILADIRKGS